jgi:hypothetical protein
VYRGALEIEEEKERVPLWQAEEPIRGKFEHETAQISVFFVSRASAVRLQQAGGE